MVSVVCTLHIWSSQKPVDARCIAIIEFVHAFLSKFHTQEKLLSVHVYFFPVCVLTYWAHCSMPENHKHITIVPSLYVAG